MSEFGDMEDLLQDFLQEAGDLLSGVDNKLVDLEKRPNDRGLLNDIFRGFHTIKGGAGFINAGELVALCHLTENLFDRLRNGELQIVPETMDVIMAATGEVRRMFGQLRGGQMPSAADSGVTRALQVVLEGDAAGGLAAVTVAPEVPAAASAAEGGGGEPDWPALLRVVSGGKPEVAPAAAAPSVPKEAAAPAPKSQAAAAAAAVINSGVARETTIRIDTERLDQVLTLSGEIGLTKNRLNCLRTDLVHGKNDDGTLRALDDAVSQLDLLVSSLQNAVMKTRMQPISRLFQKYPRIARDLARQLGKDVDLVLSGEETEIDKTMLEDLNDPLVHLVRNAIDHGVEGPEERQRGGKAVRAQVHLSARQEGDHIVIEIADDGRGMSPETIRQKAVEKGLISPEAAAELDDRGCLNLIFLPGFSTKNVISDVSGRGVGMDVVKTNIQKLNGQIDIESNVGKGTVIAIGLPLTLAILPVLLMRLGEQPFAVPLTLVREILKVEPKEIQQVGGKPMMIVRGEVIPVLSLAGLIGWQEQPGAKVGVLIQSAETQFILVVDSFTGRDDVVIKSLDAFRPKGVAGVTMSAEGEIVLILDVKELLSQPSEQAYTLFADEPKQLAMAA
ncbi:two-component system, chemotaxis family, sensor kinase CheA [Burkholderiales bacterium]|nr:two-component system, chemotaxis family, sensor kinase CheA [Burkholderiales bacterium]